MKSNSFFKYYLGNFICNYIIDLKMLSYRFQIYHYDYQLFDSHHKERNKKMSC